MIRFLRTVGLLALCGAAGLAQSQELVIGGTGSALGALQRLAEAFVLQQPSVKATVLPSLGSGGGLKALQAGALHVAVSSRPPKPAELAAGSSVVELGRTPFVVAVSADNPTTSVSRDQLAALLAGHTVAWADGSMARPVLRPPDDADSVALRALGPAVATALDAAHKRPGVPVALTDQDCADRIAQTPGAFGPTTLALLLGERRPLKALALDGQLPGVKALVEKRYAHARTLWLVSGPQPLPATAGFLAFVRSPAGRAMLAELGIWAS